MICKPLRDRAIFPFPPFLCLLLLHFLIHVPHLLVPPSSSAPNFQKVRIGVSGCLLVLLHLHSNLFSLLLDLAGNYVSTSFPHSRALALFSSSILFIIHLYLTLILVLILLIYLPPSLHWPSPSPPPPPSPPLSSLHEISWYGRISVLCQALASLLHHGVSHSGNIQDTKHRTKCLSPSIHQPQMFSN